VKGGYKLFWRKKKIDCKHYWFELQIKKDWCYVYNGIDSDCELIDYAYVYCPKCSTRKRITLEEWLKVKKERLILDNFLGGTTMDLTQFQATHTAIGVALGTLAKTNDVRKIRELQDNLSKRLEITPVRNLNDLYEVIGDSIDATKAII
jgi:hypothetical protein